jgi:N-acetylglucosamine kinase-like BadF-type ATPase
MDGYLLGVDVGGTKTHALLADGAGRVLGFGASGPGNYEVVGWDGLRRALAEAVNSALAAAGAVSDDVAAAGFGVAGFDWPGERAPTEAAIDSLGLAANYGLVNDAVIALLAGAQAGWGVALVAGTSNNCRGRDPQGREGRVTGCGPALGEYGGGTEVVARAVQDVARAWTRRGPATALAELLVGRAGARDAADLLEGLVLGRYHLSAADAPAVLATAGAGDRVAQEIARWAGRELASLAGGVIRQLGFEALAFDLILAGSLYDGSPLLVEALHDGVWAVAPRARPVRLAVPPVVGGVLLAAEKAGLDRAPLRRRLLAAGDLYPKDAPPLGEPGDPESSIC